MNAQDIRPDLINADLLPHSLQELTDVIGLTAALKLAAAFPGVPLYIPAKAEPDHRIAQIIGIDAFTALVKEYQQDTLKLPKVDAAERQIKHGMVKAMKREGQSNRTIALEMNYTQRHVERLVSNQRNDLQNDMFED